MVDIGEAGIEPGSLFVFRRMEEGKEQEKTVMSAWLQIGQLGNADDMLRFQMRLEDSLKKKVAKLMAEEVRERNRQGANPAEPIADFALRVGRVINNMLHSGLLAAHVGLGGADELQLLEGWGKRALPVLAINGNVDMTEQAAAVAKQLTLSLLEFLCAEQLGTTVEKVLHKAKQERARVVVGTDIKLEQPTTVRANVVRFFKMHGELHGAPSPQLAVADLYSRLDDGIVRLMPGKSEACALLEAPVGANEAARLIRYQEGAKALAIKADDAADKLYSAPKPKDKKPMGPTVPREDKNKDKSKSEESGSSGERGKKDEDIKCWECGEKGRYKGHKGCTRSLKKQQPCNVCLQVGHFQRECPKQICVGCKKEGHSLHQCPAGAANKQQDSACLLLAAGAAAEPLSEGGAMARVAGSTGPAVPLARGAVTGEQPGGQGAPIAAGGVLVVSGKVNGVPTLIGIDSFAGIAMATAAAAGTTFDK